MGEPYLTMRIDGASADEIQRGLAAARKVFDDAEVKPAQLAISSPVWDEADKAALMACCQGWDVMPHHAHLEVVFPDAEEAPPDLAATAIA